MNVRIMNDLFMPRGRKSQYFIVASIIFISLALMLVSSVLVGGTRRNVFDELKQNFLVEANVAINSAVSLYHETGQSVPDQFDSYVQNYIEYAASRNVDFRLIYFMLYEDRIYAKNNLDIPVVVSTRYDRYDLEPGQMINTTAYNFIEMSAGNRQYLFLFDESPLQLRSLFELSIRNE